MGFVQANPLLAKESVDIQSQLSQFREKVRGQVAPPFMNQSELCLQVMKAINNEAIPSGRGIGYIRADSLDSFRPLDEVRRIEQRNHELEAEISSLRLRPPETANGLASGSDQITVQVFHRFTSFVHAEQIEEWHPFATDWNCIFKIVAMAIHDNPQDQYVRSQIALFASYQTKAPPRQHYQLATVSLATTEFHMIRTQLVEQGLVTWEDKVWTLTPRDKRAMAELTTVKKATPATPTS